MRRTIHSVMTAAALAAALAWTPGAAAATSLSDTLLGAEDGSLRLRFATREGVYGRGDNIRVRENGRPTWKDCWSNDADDARPWTRGPLRILLRFRDGALVEVDARVGAEDPPARKGRGEVRDLGAVDPLAGAEALLDLAARGRGKALDDLLLPAMLAEGAEIWPRLLALARDDGRPRGLRGHAVFWLGQAAGDAATAGLLRLVDDDDEDLEIREQAIFALSQREADESFPVLSRIATTSPHPQLRQRALFWLAQDDEDPRVLALFEDILLGR